MPTPTTNLLLDKALGGDLTNAYLKTNLATALDRVDARAARVWFDVKDARFGAVGDGTTDDTVAVQAAFAAAAAAGPGSGVRFTDGAYKLTSPVTATGVARMTVSGTRNARLLPVVGTAAVLSFTSCTDLLVEGFTVDATGSGTAALGVACYTCSRARVRGLVVTGVRQVTSPAGCGVLLSGCSDSAVEGCWFTGNGAGAAAGTASEDVMISGGVRNHVRGNHCVSSAVTMNIGVEDATFCDVVGNLVGNAITRTFAVPPNDAWGYGIYTYGHLGTTPVQHVLIADNVVFTTGGMGIYLQATQASVVANNVLYNTCQTIVAASLAVGAIAANSDSSDIVIVGNTIDVSGQAGVRFDCIQSVVANNRVSGATGPGVYAVAGAVDRSRIAGNVITGCGGGVYVSIATTVLHVEGNVVNGATGGNHGFSFTSVTNLSCQGNTARACGGYGIILASCADGEVASNTCVSNNASAGSFDGLYVASTSTNLNVHHNRSTGASQVYGLRLDGSGHAATENHLKGNGTGPYTGTATASTLRGNRFSTAVAQGVATLTAGTVTVSTAEVQAADNVLLVRKATGGTAGHLSLGTIVAGTSFVINSSSGTDTSTVYWEIVH